MQKHNSPLASLRLVYAIMLASSLAFTLTSIIIVNDDGFEAVSWNKNTILVVCLFFAAVSGTIARTLFKKGMNEMEATDTLRSKFDTYTRASIVALAVIEGSVFFSLACYFLTGEIRMLIAAAIMIGYFLTYYPSIKKVATHINESPEDVKRQLQS
jgi:hypothetical protein